MTISMYNASVPVFKQMLTALHEILSKAEDFTQTNGMNPEALLKASLIPDMFDFIRQVQIATDFAKGVSARLAGMEVPVFEDNETSFKQLQMRIKNTLAFISDIDPAKIEGSEAREIITRPGTPKEKKFNGQDYLIHYGLPQFFFHVTTAYDVLRHKGVEIGKRDFMGQF
ncbi:MAG: DUF1993 domain-containing protein [Legionella sp.]|nr:DUF1993 domain-containing protein [Legionella sp.]